MMKTHEKVRSFFRVRLEDSSSGGCLLTPLIVSVFQFVRKSVFAQDATMVKPLVGGSYLSFNGPTLSHLVRGPTSCKYESAT